MAQKIRISETLLIALLMIFSSCSGAQNGETQTADDGNQGENGEEVIESDEEIISEEGSADGHPACVAYGNRNLDRLRRWVTAFPLRQGGTVMVFRGGNVDQMEVEVVLEMAAIVGYEDYTCGAAIVVWVPGLECHGPDAELAARIETETTMNQSELECFSIDETRMRINEECSNGNLPADVCN